MGLKRHVMRRSSGELFGLISRDVRTAAVQVLSSSTHDCRREIGLARYRDSRHFSQDQFSKDMGMANWPNLKHCSHLTPNMKCQQISLCPIFKIQGLSDFFIDYWNYHIIPP